MNRRTTTNVSLALAASALVAGGSYAAIHGYETRHVVSNSAASVAAAPNSNADPGSDAISAALNKAAATAAHASVPSTSTVSLKPSHANPDDASNADTAAAFHGSASSKPTNGVSDRNAAYASSHSTNAAQTLASMKPNRLYIPSINLYVSVVPETVAGKYLQVPQESWRVGWDSQTADPSAASGNTVIAGHVSFDGIRGAFADLAKLAPGSLIYESDSSGTIHTYRTATPPTIYGKNALPTSVFYPATDRALTLITCGGSEGRVDGPNGAYYGHLDNVVVQAVPVAS